MLEPLLVSVVLVAITVVIHAIGTTRWMICSIPYKSKQAGLQREDLLNQLSLRSIDGYLRNSDKIYRVHNADDLILRPGEIEFFPGGVRFTGQDLSDRRALRQYGLQTECRIYARPVC